MTSVYSESAIAPLLRTADAQALYLLTLLASRDVTAENPEAFDQGYADVIAQNVAALILAQPEEAGRVVTDLLVTLATAERALKEGLS